MYAVAELVLPGNVGVIAGGQGGRQLDSAEQRVPSSFE
jgi:hypothetical protein